MICARRRRLLLSLLAIQWAACTDVVSSGYPPVVTACKVTSDCDVAGPEYVCDDGGCTVATCLCDEQCPDAGLGCELLGETPLGVPVGECVASSSPLAPCADAGRDGGLDGGPDGGETSPDGGVDAGPDAGLDAGESDGGPEDAGVGDAGQEDGGRSDGGIKDAGEKDAGEKDAGLEDGGHEDGGREDGGLDAG
jgi:hypothetical protein